MGPRASLDEYGSFAPTGIRSSDHPGRSESLYRLRYPGHFILYSRNPLIRTLVILIDNYPDRLGPSVKFVENSRKQTCLEITGYRIKYMTAFLFSRTANQAWSKGLDADTCCKL